MINRKSHLLVKVNHEFKKKEIKENSTLYCVTLRLDGLEVQMHQ